MKYLSSKSLWNGLLCLQRWIMIVTSIFMVVIVFASVVIRYIFKSDLYGIEEIVTMVAFWLYFIGSSYGSYEKTQISADLITNCLKKEKHKQLLNIIKLIISLVILTIVLFWAFQFILFSIKMDPRSAIYRFPMIVPQSSILIGFILMTFYTIVYLYEDI